MHFTSGIHVYANGDRYEGEYLDDKMHGYGELAYRSGDLYKGTYHHGHRLKGHYTWSSGCSYDGEWKDGLQHGNAVYIYSNGDEYKGEYRLGKFHGKGILKYKSGIVYSKIHLESF